MNPIKAINSSIYFVKLARVASCLAMLACFSALASEPKKPNIVSASHFGHNPGAVLRKYDIPFVRDAQPDQMGEGRHIEERILLEDERPGSRPIAYCKSSHQDSVGHIDLIGVNEAHRRLGHGEQLLKYVCDSMEHDHNVKTTYLEALPGAVNFYRKCGFIVDRWAPAKPGYVAMYRNTTVRPRAAMQAASKEPDASSLERQSPCTQLCNKICSYFRLTRPQRSLDDMV